MTRVVTHHRGVAQLASAPRLGRGGRRFESSIPDHFIFSPVNRGVAQLASAQRSGR